MSNECKGGTGASPITERPEGFEIPEDGRGDAKEELKKSSHDAYTGRDESEGESCESGDEGMLNEVDKAVWLCIRQGMDMEMSMD